MREQLAIDPSALKRFEREAKAVAALSHPNILDIHEFDITQETRFRRRLRLDTYSHYPKHAKAIQDGGNG